MQRGISVLFTVAFVFLLCGSQVVQSAVPTSCMQAETPGEIAGGLLAQRSFKNAAGRSEFSYILTLPTPTCLKGSEESDNVSPTQTIQLYSSDDAIEDHIRRFVGKRVMVTGRAFGALTAHRHAPIVMDINDIDLP
jgi:Domain of unknown function (DUF4431)